MIVARVSEGLWDRCRVVSQPVEGAWTVALGLRAAPKKLFLLDIQSQGISSRMYLRHPLKVGSYLAHRRE